MQKKSEVQEQNMKPAVMVLVLCLSASVLAGIHRMICEQKYESTSRCDLAFGIPFITMLAIACGVSGLAVLATSEDT